MTQNRLDEAAPSLIRENMFWQLKVFLAANASRPCLAGGSWSPLTDYSSCMELCVEYDHQNNTSKYIDCDQDPGADTEISVHLYFIGEYLY